MNSDRLVFSPSLYEEVIKRCHANYPNQSRGLFAAREDTMRPTSFHLLESTRYRADPDAKALFASFGPYYRDHKGFVTDPLELMRVSEELDRRGERMVGLFHVHIDFPAAPSRLDVKTFTQTCPDSASIWYAILSFLNPVEPEFRVFWIRNELTQEIAVDTRTPLTLSGATL